MSRGEQEAAALPERKKAAERMPDSDYRNAMRSLYKASDGEKDESSQ